MNFVEILEDRNGKSKGSAVVEFREKESVERCVEALHRFVMNDRMLTAKEIRVYCSGRLTFFIFCLFSSSS